MTPSGIEPATFRIVAAGIGHIQVIQNTNKKILRGLIQLLSISDILYYMNMAYAGRNMLRTNSCAHTHTHTRIHTHKHTHAHTHTHKINKYLFLWLTVFSLLSVNTLTELQRSGIVRNITYTAQTSHRISERYNGRCINLPLCSIVSGTDLAATVMVPNEPTRRTVSYARAVLVEMPEHRQNYVHRNYRQLLYSTPTAVHNVTTTVHWQRYTTSQLQYTDSGTQRHNYSTPTAVHNVTPTVHWQRYTSHLQYTDSGTQRHNYSKLTAVHNVTTTAHWRR